MPPAISIITPAYRAQPFITRAVRSVLAQDEPAWEMIIVSDDACDYAALFKAQSIDDPRIRFATTGQTASGPGHARNVGLDMADGRLIATLDADDMFLPGKLSVMAPKALLHGLCSCAMEYVQYEGGTAHALTPPTPFMADGLIGAALYPKVNYYGNSMVVFDRSTLRLRWPETWHAMEDLVFAMQAYDYTDAVYHCAQPLHRYIRRSQSLSNSADTPQHYIRIKQEILKQLEREDFCVRSPAARQSLREFFTVSLATEEEYYRAAQSGQAPLFTTMLARKLAQAAPAIPHTG
jgi:succinoglycan biosynthesis protein ExoO